MVTFSSVLVGLSSGTLPFSISTLPSITCVSTPLAAWTNFWRFQKKETKSKSTGADALLIRWHYVQCNCVGVESKHLKAENTQKRNVNILLEQQRAAVPQWWWGDWPCADGSWVQNGWWPWHGARPLETCTLKGWRSWSRPPSPPSRGCKAGWASLRGGGRRDTFLKT